jgi:hypothetical protein
MRRFAVVLAALTVVTALAAGCSGQSTGGPATASTGTGPSPRNSKLVQPCADVQKTINSSTTRFTGRLVEAVAAGEGGDTAGRDKAIVDIRAAFAEWSTQLRQQADRATDAEFKAVLTEYAGAVDAAIARVHTPADLDKLYTFDDQELDTVASRLADLCH